MPEPKDLEDGSPRCGSGLGEPRENNYEGLPKCFRAIAAFRQDVNTKRVLTGDTRSALWESLEELVNATTELADASLKDSHGRAGNTREDITLSRGRFDNVLTAFHASKDDYEKLDTDLRGLDYRLAEEEMRVYNHLETGDAPPSVYDRSFPLLSIPDDPSPRENLPFGEPSVDGTDLYDFDYGLLSSMGEYPGLIADKDLFSNTKPSYLLQTEYSLPDPKSPVLSGPLPKPHPLILDSCSLDRLGSYPSEFGSNRDRINNWLLHIFRSSHLEIERLWNSYENKTRKIAMDETAWSEYVLDVWPQDIYLPDSQPDLQWWLAPIREIPDSLTSYSVIPGPKDLVSSRHARHFATLDQGRDPARGIGSREPSWPEMHRKQWPESTAKPQPISKFIQTLRQRAFDSIKWPLKRKRGISKTRHTTGPTIEAASKSRLGSQETGQRTDTPKPASQIASSLTVSPSEKANGPCRSDSIVYSKNAGSSREWRRPSTTVSGSVQKDLKEGGPVQGEGEPILSTSNTKELSGGQVFLVSIKSLVVPDPKQPEFYFSIFEEIFPSLVFFIAIEVNRNSEFVLACPVLKDENHKLNLAQNKYRDLVLCSDASDYTTYGEVHVRLTSSRYIFPFHEQLRLNSTVKFIIPFGVATLGIGYVDRYDLHKISHDSESLAEQRVDSIPRTLFSTLGPRGPGEMYSYDKGYAVPGTYTVPESIWDGISTDPDGLERLYIRL